jgi:hypothetical protein
MTTYDVFLSYSRKDSRIFQTVRDTLRNAGLVVWTDDHLKPGTASWKNAIEHAIEHSRCVVVILSPDSKNSVWVERELDYASSHRKPIFPLLARGKEQEAVPFEVGNIQRADIREDFMGGMRTLVSAICTELGMRDLSRRVGASFAETTRVHRKPKRWRWATVLPLVIALVGLGLTMILRTDVGSRVVLAERAADARLLYDEDSLTLYNVSNQTLDISGLTFRLAERVFISDEWAASGRAVYRLAAGDCFQLWPRGAGQQAIPAECRYRQGWREINAGRVFWTEQDSGAESAAFEVRRGADLLAQCPLWVQGRVQACEIRLRP